jgi:hypothetical protein
MSTIEPTTPLEKYLQAEVGRLRAALNRAGDRLAQVQPGVTEPWAFGIVPKAEQEIADALGRGEGMNDDEMTSDGLVLELQAEVERLRPVVEYAANMPDDENMPEWAKELRYHARNALPEEKT